MAGTELGKAWVQIVPSAKGISGSISNVLSGEVNSAGDKAGLGISGRIKKAIAAAGIGATIGKALSEGGKLQQSYIGGLETLYGNAAEKAREYARAAVQAGVSQNEFSEQAVSFGAALKKAYGNDTSKAIDAANTAIMDMTDNAAKMGTPLQSIQDAYQGFAKQNYTMLDNLKLGYGGTKAEMERLLSEAEKLSGQKYDISNLGDVYEAIHVIQDDLGLVGVAAGEAATTFSGSMAAMKAAGENLLGNLMLGENISKSMQDLVTTSTTFLFDNLIPAVGRIFASLPEAIGAAITTGLPLIGQNAAQLITALTDGINNNAPKIAAALPGAVDSAIQKISQNGPAIMAKGAELLKNLGLAIINNAPQLASAAASAVDSLVNYIGQNAPQLASRGGELIAQLALGLIKNLPKIAATAVKVISFLVRTLNSLGSTLVRSGLSLMASVAAGITSGIASKVKSAMSRIKTAIAQPIEAAKDKVKSILDKIKGFFPISIGRVMSGLKLPHFSISGSFSLNPPSVPHFGISWYRKAMGMPFLFRGATLFGAGEAGDEVLYGRSRLMKDIKEAAGSGQSMQMTNYFYINGADNPAGIADTVVRELEIELRTG